MTRWRHYLLFSLAFLGWGGCFYASLTLIGGVLLMCRGDEHYVPGCNSIIATLIGLVPFVILIGGAWVLKRLASRWELRL